MPKIKKNISLKKYTSFKIGGSARFLSVARTRQDIIDAVLWAQDKQIPFIILGSG